MRRLPVYPSIPIPPIQATEPLDNNPNCERCEFSRWNPLGERCMPASGEPGDILVVLEGPTEYERKTRNAATSAAGKWLRDLFKRLAPGRKVVYAYAVGCRPPKPDLVDDWQLVIESCRGYVSAVLAECAPQIIFLMGQRAIQSFTDDNCMPLSVREGYSFAVINGKPVPAWFTLSHATAFSNRLYSKALEEDISKALARPNPTTYWDKTYEVISTPEDSKLAYDVLLKAPYVATDVETSGMMHEPDFRIECLSISDGDRTFVWSRDAIENAGVRPWLIRALRELDHATWNGQYDLLSVHYDALLSPNTTGKPFGMNLVSDSRVKRKLYEADAAADLATAANLVGMGGHKKEAREVLDHISTELRKIALSKTPTPKGKTRKPPAPGYIRSANDVPEAWCAWILEGFATEKFAYRWMPLDIIHRYNARDALSTWHLEAWANEKLLTDEGLLTIWHEVAQPAMWAYARMRINGFPVDRGALEVFKVYLETNMADVLRDIQMKYPNFNPNAPQQVANLMKVLGVKSKRTTESGAVATGIEVLEEIKDQHPIFDLILQYREYSKALGTYAIGLMSFIRSDGCVHASFLQDGTGTGRASSSDPNLFNQPKGRTKRKKILADMLRGAFHAPPGWKILELDEGQIEIRTLAHQTKDPAMQAPLKEGVDFHMVSAKRFAVAMNKNPDAVTEMDRDQAKTSVFAAAYEIPAQLGFMLSKRLNIPRKDGDMLAKAMFEGYAGMRTWMELMYVQAWETGVARTNWKGANGRKRPLWRMGNNPRTLKELEEKMQHSRGDRGNASFDLNEARSTWNGPNQGLAADIVTSMLWDVQVWLDENTDGGKLVLHIYDSIMVIVKDEDVEKTLAYMRERMTRGILDVPLIVDAKVGQTWNTMKKV